MAGETIGQAAGSNSPLLDLRRRGSGVTEGRAPAGPSGLRSLRGQAPSKVYADRPPLPHAPHSYN